MIEHDRLCAVMAQILSIYGLVISVIISNDLAEKMSLFTGFVQLGSGLAVGLCGMAAGFAIGIVGDAGGKISHDRKCPSSTCVASWTSLTSKQ